MPKMKVIHGAFELKYAAKIENYLEAVMVQSRIVVVPVCMIFLYLYGRYKKCLGNAFLTVLYKIEF